MADSGVDIGLLLAEIGRQQKELYKLGAEAGVHPTRLGRMLRGKAVMPPRVYENVCSALRIIRQGSDEAG